MTAASSRPARDWTSVAAGDGILLREIDVEQDAEGVHRVHADPRVYVHDPQEVHADLAHTRNVLTPFRVHWDQHGFGYWTVLVPEPWWPAGVRGTRARDDGRRIAGLGGIRRHELLGAAVLNVYFRLAPEVQGRGLGTLVLRAALDCAADVEPSSDVVVRTRPANVGARRTAERAGFVDEGPDPDDPGLQLLRRRSTEAAEAARRDLGLR